MVMGSIMKSHPLIAPKNEVDASGVESCYNTVVEAIHLIKVLGFR